MGAGGGGCGRTRSGVAREVDRVGSGCAVLWSLKQGIEQLGSVSRRVEGRGGGDGLWERAGWTLVFLRFGGADAAEGVGHAFYRRSRLRAYW